MDAFIPSVVVIVIVINTVGVVDAVVVVGVLGILGIGVFDFSGVFEAVEVVIRIQCY